VDRARRSASLPPGWAAVRKRVTVATPEGDAGKAVTYYTHTIDMNVVLIPPGASGDTIRLFSLIVIYCRCRMALSQDLRESWLRTCRIMSPGACLRAERTGRRDSSP